jgi:DNA-binding transcriptional LysR family regulator
LEAQLRKTRTGRLLKEPAMMRFTLKQIEYFVAAAETGSITLASERVHISQPSISSAVSTLEAEFGVQLFIRHHAQGLSLTAQGQRFLREAKSLLLQAEELTAAATQLSTKVGGVLTLGCLTTLYPLVIPEMIQAFKARHRAVRIEAIAGDQAGLFEQLRTGRLSLALSYDMDVPADLEFTPLATLPPFAFVSVRHPLARRERVTMEQLAAHPFLLLDLPISRDYFLSLFHRVGLVPPIAGRFEHMEVIRSLAARGEGFGLANAQPRNRSSLDGGKLAYLVLDGDPRPLMLGILMVKNTRCTQTMDAFIAQCHEIIRDQWQAGMG